MNPVDELHPDEELTTELPNPVDELATASKPPTPPFPVDEVVNHDPVDTAEPLTPTVKLDDDPNPPAPPKPVDELPTAPQPPAPPNPLDALPNPVEELVSNAPVPELATEEPYGPMQTMPTEPDVPTLQLRPIPVEVDACVVVTLGPL